MKTETAVRSFLIYLIASVYAIIFFFLMSAGRYPFSIYAIIAIVSGVSISFIASYFFEIKELKKIEHKGENSVTLIKISLLTCFIASYVIIFTIAFIILGNNFSWLSVMNLHSWVLLYFVLPMLPTIFITRIVLVRKWEQKHNRKLLIERKKVIFERTYVAPPLTIQN